MVGSERDEREIEAEGGEVWRGRAEEKSGCG